MKDLLDTLAIFCESNYLTVVIAKNTVSHDNISKRYLASSAGTNTAHCEGQRFKLAD
jgi:hypothetical protein